MFVAIENNLLRGVRLLESITDQQYSDCSVPPYYSSIGNHMRHVLDVFSCIFNGLPENSIDFSVRERNELAQTKTSVGLAYFNTIIAQLNEIKEADLNRLVCVQDDLGFGLYAANYTVAAVLMQAHSHAIHHFATIGYIVHQLNIALPDADFGYNPSTPR